MLLVGFIVVFVSLTARAAIWLVDADILHENFEPLTGLFNRDGFYEKAMTLLASRSRGDDRYLAVAVVNLDTFSLVGEFSGMSGSNRARVEIAARLRETARRDAVIAHIADSEFVIADLSRVTTRQRSSNACAAPSPVRRLACRPASAWSPPHCSHSYSFRRTTCSTSCRHCHQRDV